MKRLLFCLFATLLSLVLSAKVSLPSVIDNGMVLQQKSDVALWGKAKAGKTVTVTESWSGKAYKAKVGKDGKWMIRIFTPQAGGPYSITFDDGEKLTLDDILIGEVWLASGQSNMEMMVRGGQAQPCEGGAELILAARPSTPIRMYKAQHIAAIEPADDVKGKWYRHTSEGVGQCSAVAYFFAKEVFEHIEVPIGIVEADWGGSSIQAWMRRDILEKEFPEISFEKFLEDATSDNQRVRRKAPSAIYNGELHPLMPYTVKGFLWYQGESNRYDPEQYTRLQTSFVKMLREEFCVPDAPFYFVQIAPYGYNDKDKYRSGYFCEAQEKTLKTIPNSGMATTLDLGEVGNIHPRRKAQIGKRLAWHALVRDYGYKGISPEAPSYESVSFEKGKATIKVKSDKYGVNPAGAALDGFEIAGADKKFHKAEARVRDKGHSILVWSTEVPEPVAVRYCFHNWAVASVFSQWGVPMVPFRTDNWELEED